jgi:hypothetical protein
MNNVVKQLERALARPVPARVKRPSLERRKHGLDPVNVRIAMLGLDLVQLGLERSDILLILSALL